MRTTAAALLLLLLAALTACGDTVDDPRRRPTGGLTGSGSRELVVGTLNIHYVAEDQQRLDWDRRKEAVVAAIREGDPDLMAFQEMETFEGGSFSRRNLQLDYLRDNLPGYEFGAVGDPREYPYTQPVMFRSERFELLEQGFFFFSRTPDEIYSRSWDGRYPAFCSWVRLSDRQRGMSFYLYNVHFDHGSRGNRLRAAELVVDRIERRSHPEDPVILAGDLNAIWFFRPVRILTGSGLELAPIDGATVHFMRGINIIPAIDHVLYSEGLEFLESRVIRSKFEGHWPSDHYPVFVTLR